MPEVYCDHEGCLHFRAFKDGPKHLPGFKPYDWDKGYPGYCLKETIGIQVKIIEGGKVKHTIPGCQCHSRRKDWRIHLPYPDEIAKRGGRQLGSQEHDSSR